MMLTSILMAAVNARSILVVNAGDDAIFTLQVGHAATSTWSDDVLGFDRVIEVSKGKMIRIPFDAGTCVYDLQATYRNGSMVVDRNIDLCKVERVDFKE